MPCFGGPSNWPAEGARRLSGKRSYPRPMRRGGFYHMPTIIPRPDARPLNRKTLRRVMASFRPYRKRVTVVGTLIVITAALGVVNPLLIRSVFRALIPVLHLHRLYVLVAFMVGIPILSGLIGIGQTYLANVVGQRVMQDFRNALYGHLQMM